MQSETAVIAKHHRAALHGPPDVTERFRLRDATEGEACARRHHAANGCDGLGDSAFCRCPSRPAKSPRTFAAKFNSDAGERSFLEFLYAREDAPTDEELRRAHEKLDEFYRGWWRRRTVSGNARTRSLIHDLQRRAAARLGLEKEWHYQARETESVPVAASASSQASRLQIVPRDSRSRQGAGAGTDSGAA